MEQSQCAHCEGGGKELDSVDLRTGTKSFRVCSVCNGTGKVAVDRKYFTQYPDLSLQKFNGLVSQYGKPVSVLIVANHDIRVTFRNGATYILGGFTVGYHGTGPDYTLRMLHQAGFDVSSDEIAGMKPPVCFPTKAEEHSPEEIPTSTQSPLQLGTDCLKAGRLDEAIQHLEEAVSENSDDYRPLTLSGIAYAQKGLYSEAVTRLEAAIKLDPSQASLYFNLGEVYRRSGAHEKAREHYQQAVKIEPTYAKAREALKLVSGQTKHRSRFVDQDEGIVVDSQTRLMWQKEDDGDMRTLQESKDYCRSLTLGGYSDWRLPSIDELRTVSEHWNEIFIKTKGDEPYWSSTVMENPTPLPADSPMRYAAKVLFSDGQVNQYFVHYHYYTRAVRSCG